MSTVFVSYRRSDSAGEAGRLVDTLKREMGRGFAFRDVVSLSPGERFDKALDRAIARAEVVIVLLGERWVTELQRRQSLPETDYHRAEIVSALAQGKRVVPVLLGHTLMPAPATLPEDLQSLTRCHALSLRDEAWQQDVSRLMDAIGRPYRLDWLLLRVAVVLPLLVLAGWKLGPLLFAERLSDYAFQRNVLAATAVVYVLMELSFATTQRLRVRRLRKASMTGSTEFSNV